MCVVFAIFGAVFVMRGRFNLIARSDFPSDRLTRHANGQIVSDPSLPREEFAVGGGRAFLSRSSIARALKVPTVLLFVGGMMFLSGQGLFAASFFQGAEGALATIPAGSTWAYVYPIKVLGAGRVFGEFADPAGGGVDPFGFGAAQYESFRPGGTGPRPHSPPGASGAFSPDLPGSGTYYPVLAPGAGFQYWGQAAPVS